MSLTFHCPNCGKQYSNIKRSLLGKKAQCSCGNTIRLGEEHQVKRSRRSASHPESPSEQQGKKQKGKGQEEPASPITHHYSDLDSILSGTGFDGDHEDSARPFQPAPSQPTARPPKTNQPRQRSATRHTNAAMATDSFDPAKLTQPESKKPSPTKTTLSFLAVVISASLAFWFGLLIVVSRFTTVDQILLHPFSQAMGNVNTARFGLEQIAPGLKIGFVICGWAIWSVAAAMILLAPLQLFNAVAQLFVRRQLFRFADGVMATCGVLLVFLMVAALFLHASHLAHLQRQLNQFDSPQAIVAGESERQNVQRIRDQYASNSRQFMTVILAGGVVPLTVFGFSMLRMLTSRSEFSQANGRY